MRAIPQLSDEESEYRKRLRRSIYRCVRDAKRREEKKGREAGDLTVSECMEMLERQKYCCALTGLKFWSDLAIKVNGKAPNGQRPRSPALDRIKHAGRYTRRNVRIVLAGVNSLRGNGSDDEMYKVAQALIRRRKPLRSTR